MIRLGIYNRKHAAPAGELSDTGRYRTFKQVSHVRRVKQPRTTQVSPVDGPNGITGRVTGNECDPRRYH